MHLLIVIVTKSVNGQGMAIGQNPKMHIWNLKAIKRQRECPQVETITGSGHFVNAFIGKSPYLNVLNMYVKFEINLTWYRRVACLRLKWGHCVVSI